MKKQILHVIPCETFTVNNSDIIIRFKDKKSLLEAVKTAEYEEVDLYEDKHGNCFILQGNCVMLSEVKPVEKSSDYYG